MSTATASRKRGRQRELHYVAKLIADGWVAYRVDGAGDIVAGRDGVTNIIQVKSTVARYSCFLPFEREELKREAEAAGWHAYLLWWPKGVGIDRAKLIHSDDWP